MSLQYNSNVFYIHKLSICYLIYIYLIFFIINSSLYILFAYDNIDDDFIHLHTAGDP